MIYFSLCNGNIFIIHSSNFKNVSFSISLQTILATIPFDDNNRDLRDYTTDLSCCGQAGF